MNNNRLIAVLIVLFVISFFWPQSWRPSSSHRAAVPGKPILLPGTEVAPSDEAGGNKAQNRGKKKGKKRKAAKQKRGKGVSLSGKEHSSLESPAVRKRVVASNSAGGGAGVDIIYDGSNNAPLASLGDSGQGGARLNILGKAGAEVNSIVVDFGDGKQKHVVRELVEKRNLGSVELVKKKKRAFITHEKAPHYTLTLKQGSGAVYLKSKRAKFSIEPKRKGGDSYVVRKGKKRIGSLEWSDAKESIIVRDARGKVAFRVAADKITPVYGMMLTDVHPEVRSMAMLGLYKLAS